MWIQKVQQFFLTSAVTVNYYFMSTTSETKITYENKCKKISSLFFFKFLILIFFFVTNFLLQNSVRAVQYLVSLSESCLLSGQESVMYQEIYVERMSA